MGEDEKIPVNPLVTYFYALMAFRTLRRYSTKRDDADSDIEF